MEAELLRQGSGFSGQSDVRIDRRAGSGRDFRPAVPSGAFPGRLPTTSSTSLVRDAAPGRNQPGRGPRGRELQVGARSARVLAALLGGEPVGLGPREAEKSRAVTGGERAAGAAGLLRPGQ